MKNIYENFDEYNPNKILIVFDDIIANMVSNTKVNPIVKDWFEVEKWTFLFFLSYFAVVKIIKLNSTHYFNMKIPNKREIQQIAINNSLDADF